MEFLTAAGADTRPPANPLINLPNCNKATSCAAAWQMKLTINIGATNIIDSLLPKACPIKPPKKQQGIVAKVGKLANHES